MKKVDFLKEVAEELGISQIRVREILDVIEKKETKYYKMVKN